MNTAYAKSCTDWLKYMVGMFPANTRIRILIKNASPEITSSLSAEIFFLTVLSLKNR